MANYLVTGGCGFIGSHLCDALIRQGHQVRVLDNLSTGKLEYLAEGAELIVGDIRDRTLVQTLIEQVDGCFHLAAIASVERSNIEWQETHTVNQSATVNIFEACASTTKKVPVVYASSAAVYGDSSDLPLKESSHVQPLSAYGVDKLSCELQAKIAGAIHSVPTMAFRLFNVYGERQDPHSPYSGVISIFLNQIAHNQPLNLYGDGSQIRDFVYVKDVIKFLIAGMSKVQCDAPVFNLCTGKPSSIKSLAEILFQVTGTTTSLICKPTRAGDIQVSLGDETQLVAFFNMAPSFDLKKGLNEILKR